LRVVNEWPHELGDIMLYFDVDTEIEHIIDEFFLTKTFKKVKMIREDDVMDVIRDCVDTPKGVVPDSVYEILPNIQF